MLKSRLSSQFIAPDGIDSTRKVTEVPKFRQHTYGKKSGAKPHRFTDCNPSSTKPKTKETTGKARWGKWTSYRPYMSSTILEEALPLIYKFHWPKSKCWSEECPDSPWHADTMMTLKLTVELGKPWFSRNRPDALEWYNLWLDGQVWLGNNKLQGKRMRCMWVATQDRVRWYHSVN